MKRWTKIGLSLQRHRILNTSRQKRFIALSHDASSQPPRIVHDESKLIQKELALPEDPPTAPAPASPPPHPDNPNDDANSDRAKYTPISKSFGRGAARLKKSNAKLSEKETKKIHLEAPQWFIDRNVTLFRKPVRVMSETGPVPMFTPNDIIESPLPIHDSKQNRYLTPESTFKEVLAIARTSYILPDEASVNSEASKKSHILLQCATEHSTYYLDQIVQSTAAHLGAHLVKLDAQDFEQLASALYESSDYAPPFNASAPRTLSYPKPPVTKSDVEQEEAEEYDEDDMEPSHEFPQRGVVQHQLMGMFAINLNGTSSANTPDSALQNPSSLQQKLFALLDSLVHAPLRKMANDAKLQMILPSPPDASESPATAPPLPPRDKTACQENLIVYVREYDALASSMAGAVVLKVLRDVVETGRRKGEKILIMGGVSGAAEHMPSHESNEQRENIYYRTISVPLQSNADTETFLAEDKAKRIREVNLRHIQHLLLRRFGKAFGRHDTSDVDVLMTKEPVSLQNWSQVGDSIFSFDYVHRICTIAVGERDARYRHASHIISIKDMVEASILATEADKEREVYASALSALQEVKKKKDELADKKSGKLKAVKPADCNKHEKKLLGGIINPENLKIGFAQVRAPQSTIKTLRTIISLPLINPEAFAHGILAQNQISGVLLFGPPGSGKTLLAKAVAKESGARVLEVKGSEIFDMYVGEGEKNVKAIFSLAKKLSPCVVFIDEVDAIFGSRQPSHSTPSHREIINQFMSEWDGLSGQTSGVLLMGATNRPFDIDEAIIRRMPQRILVDLPNEDDRSAILEIHLKEETLDPSVQFSDLAKRTVLYSGSDLKNLGVSAALIAVDEAMTAGDATPRVLHKRHFDQALANASPSINEDMSSLVELRKWDEKYGKTKKVHRGMGFSNLVGNEKRTEAKVRK